jgi:hypothetical protein
VAMLGSGPTNLHGAKTQKTNIIILTAVKNSNLSRMGIIGENKAAL